jgi:hypothetical protein
MIVMKNEIYTKWKPSSSKDIMKDLGHEIDRISNSTGRRITSTKLEIALWTRSAKTLKELSNDACSIIRYCVACNRNTTPETLMILAKDYSVGVRRSVTENPNATREVIQTVRAYEFYKEHPTL